MSTLCTTGDNRDAVGSWQRLATQEEIDAFHASGDLPLTETTALVMVFGCEIHTLPVELAARNHRATCTAPGLPDSDHGTCDCDQGPLVKADLEKRLADVVAALPPA